MKVRLNRSNLRDVHQVPQTRRRITRRRLWTLAECLTHRAQQMSSRRTTMGNSTNNLTQQRKPPRWIWTCTTSHQSWVPGKLVTANKRWVHSQYRKEPQTWSNTTLETRPQKPTSKAILSIKFQAWDLPNKFHPWQTTQWMSLRSKSEKHHQGWLLLRDDWLQTRELLLSNYKGNER